MHIFLRPKTAVIHSFTVAIGIALLLDGCASSDSQKLSAEGMHRDKDIQGVWLQPGFDFSGYETLVIVAPDATATPHNDEEASLLPWAKAYLQSELATAFRDKGTFKKVVTDEHDVQGRMLKLQSTIVDYEKGGGAARFFAGVYGGGQPHIKVRAVALDNADTKGKFDIERSGEGAGARLGGAYMSDKDIQSGDIRDLAVDFAEFVDATAKHRPRSD